MSGWLRLQKRGLEGAAARCLCVMLCGIGAVCCVRACKREMSRRSPPNHDFAKPRGLQRRLRRSKSAGAAPRVPPGAAKMEILGAGATLPKVLGGDGDHRVPWRRVVPSSSPG
eukprot:7323074-Prymnesium_polylepis.1